MALPLLELGEIGVRCGIGFILRLHGLQVEALQLLFVRQEKYFTSRIVEHNKHALDHASQMQTVSLVLARPFTKIQMETLTEMHLCLLKDVVPHTLDL